MNIIAWIVFGAIAGWLASVIAGTSESILMDILVGIIGAAIGGWLMTAFGQAGVTGFNLYSFLVAILGSVILLFVVKSFRHSRPVT